MKGVTPERSPICFNAAFERPTHPEINVPDVFYGWKLLAYAWRQLSSEKRRHQRAQHIPAVEPTYHEETATVASTDSPAPRLVAITARGYGTGEEAKMALDAELRCELFENLNGKVPEAPDEDTLVQDMRMVTNVVSQKLDRSS
ncbi:hypothetical protein BBP40_005080 [Aspergillus hancockii]|nr:hypothetical protein BBP40_005080 [Aspergillus hancockii]